MLRICGLSEEDRTWTDNLDVLTMRACLSLREPTSVAMLGLSRLWGEMAGQVAETFITGRMTRQLSRHSAGTAFHRHERV